MRRWLLTGAFLLSFASAASADLQPDEIAILAVRTSRQSRELAEHYARARGVPKAHICLLEVKPGEPLSRADWETRVRPAIRRWLAANELDQKIRCFVTVWDVPLTIGAVDAASPGAAEARQHLSAQRQFRQEKLLHLVAEIDAIYPPAEAPRREVLGDASSRKEFTDLYDTALQQAQARLRQAQEQKDPELARVAQQFERLFLEGGGAAAMLRRMPNPAQTGAPLSPELIRMFDFRRGELAALRLGQAALAALRESRERDQQLLTLLQHSDGLAGILTWIEQNEEAWRKNETYSSFDNELALLHYPPYSLMRWHENALRYGFNAAVRDALPSTLMVARIEAPTFEQAGRLIDAAIEIEKTGLAGKVYIDARGMPADKNPGSYGDYDQSLRDLAKLLKEHTKLDVVLDDKGELFQPGDCPDAALYCGWYSLGNYVDAFQWKRGAVAYHIASNEAATLRDAKSKVWCKRMLESGVCATLGPTFEPYLAAFPRPLDFFPLLLTGEYTLIETYARTNPFNSWVITLVGDPLYNPFKNQPHFDAHKLPDSIGHLVRDRR